MDADKILRRQPWLPEDVEQLPGRVRDTEERIRTHSDEIDYLRSDMDSIRNLLKWGVGGIWMLVVQIAGAALTFWLGGF